MDALASNPTGTASIEKEPGMPLWLISDADAEKERAPALGERVPAGIGIHPICADNAVLLLAAVGAGGVVVVAWSPVGIADLASLVKTAATACKVTGSSATISCFFTAFYEITAAETAFPSTFAARPTSQRFMVVEHHNAGKQRNHGNR
jgi:hypothetical protein